MSNDLLCGFLIVKTFETLYRQFVKTFPNDMIVYSVPREGVEPEDVAKQYHGIDREALGAWSPAAPEFAGSIIPYPPAIEPDACPGMHALECQGKSEDNFIFSEADAWYIYSLLSNPKKWELIWAAQVESAIAPPAQCNLLGFEPTWFYGDHFSAVCDSMCFPRWHGTDVEGELFREHYDRLNSHGLFDTPGEAIEFLEFYASFDWTETGEYVIAEIRQVPHAVQ